MRLIIAGSREFNNYRLLDDSLSPIAQYITEVICGGARGADELGRQWAITNNIPVKMFPADWKKYGKSAGYKRNAEMANYATALVAFWDGTSRGTKHMIDLANKKEISVIVINY